MTSNALGARRPRGRRARRGGPTPLFPPAAGVPARSGPPALAGCYIVDGGITFRVDLPRGGIPARPPDPAAPRALALVPVAGVGAAAEAGHTRATVRELAPGETGGLREDDLPIGLACDCAAGAIGRACRHTRIGEHYGLVRRFDARPLSWSDWPLEIHPKAAARRRRAPAATGAEPGPRRAVG